LIVAGFVPAVWRGRGILGGPMDGFGILLFGGYLPALDGLTEGAWAFTPG